MYLGNVYAVLCKQNSNVFRTDQGAYFSRDPCIIRT